MLLKTMMAYQLQNVHYIFMRYLFSQPVIFGSDPFCYSYSGYHFTELYNKIVRKQLTFDLYIRLLHIWHIFLKIHRYETGVYTGGNSVHQLFTTFCMFFFSLFLFCLPGMCACTIFWENQNKRKPSIAHSTKKNTAQGEFHIMVLHCF